MKYYILFLIIFLIILFTFLFRRVRNPLTNLHLYYKDCTIDPKSFEVINEIYTKFHFVNYYSIYIFKTHNIPKLPKSYSFYAYTIQTRMECYVILVSTRYKMLSLIDTDQCTIMGLKDGILTLPLIPGMYGYHRFHLLINKLNNEIPINVSTNNTLIIHDGVISNGDLEILTVDFEILKNNLFKCYVIKFSDLKTLTVS